MKHKMPRGKKQNKTERTWSYVNEFHFVYNQQNLIEL